ncbi:MAG: hypothetical protein AAFP69_19160 [Planctomycetota bacterium]
MKPQGFDSDRMRELIELLYDGAIHNDEMRQLNTVLESSDDAKAFYLDAIDLHHVLERIAIPSSTTNAVSTIIQDDRPVKFTRRWFGLFAIEASLMMLAGVYVLTRTAPSESISFMGIVVDADDLIVFLEDRPIEVGSGLSAGVVFVDQGVLHAELDSGVRLSIPSG